MTPEEFNKQETELLNKVPQEFRGWLSYYAYEQGHSAGYEEVLSYLRELIYELVPAMNKFKLNHNIND